MNSKTSLIRGAREENSSGLGGILDFAGNF